MSRHRAFAVVAILAALLAVATASFAHADGPHIALHATQGCCTVTVFSAPDPLVAGPVELDVLVQRAADGSLLPHAAASGQLTLAGHAPIAFVTTPASPSNPQLPGATVQLSIAGDYALEMQVQGAAAESARFQGMLPVAANQGRRNTVLWAVFVPLLLALLFLANQQGKFQLRRQRAGQG